jgi:Leucine-rich repeat (LRR) protein
MYVDCNRWKDVMKAVSNLPCIGYLDLEYTSLAIKGPTLKEMIESLAICKSLTSLRLHGMLAGSLESIQHLTNLVSLSITFSHWHHMQVVYPDKLASLTKLTYLECQNVQTDSFCSSLCNLRTLSMHNHCATAPSIGAGLARCTNLQNLSLKNYSVEANNLASLKQLHRLEMCLMHVFLEFTTATATLEFLQTLLNNSERLAHVDYCDKDVALFSLHVLVDKFTLPGIPGWTGCFVDAHPELIVSRWMRLKKQDNNVME